MDLQEELSVYVRTRITTRNRIRRKRGKSHFDDAVTSSRRKRDKELKCKPRKEKDGERGNVLIKRQIRLRTSGIQQGVII